MRVIGGLLKRRKLFFPKISSTRPVTDRAKETIFNVLGSYPDGASVLDLFAGSGSLGIESLSRGAHEAWFVESGRMARDCIARNLKTLSLNTVGTILYMPVLVAISQLEKQDKRFNLIFLDPPHNKGLIKKVLHRLDRSVIVYPFGNIVVGHSNHEGLPVDLETLSHQRSITIGQTFVSFLTKTYGG